MPTINFASKLKQIRLKEKLTQGEFAQKIEVSQAAISRYEKGERLPELNIVYRIFLAFRVDPIWFFTTNEHEDKLIETIKGLSQQEQIDLFNKLNQ